MEDIFSGIAGLVRIYQIIRLQKDLIIQAVHALVGVMMAHQIRDPGNLHSRQPCICKKAFRQRRAFCFLIFPVGVAVFVPAQRAGNIMDDGRNLRDLLQLLRQSFAFADDTGIAVHLHQVMDVLAVARRVVDHFHKDP